MAVAVVPVSTLLVGMVLVLSTVKNFVIQVSWKMGLSVDFFLSPSSVPSPAVFCLCIDWGSPSSVASVMCKDCEVVLWCRARALWPDDSGVLQGCSGCLCGV